MSLEKMYIVWICAAVLFGIFEALTVQLVSIWFVIGAVAALVSSLAGAEFYTYDDKYKNGVSQTVIPAHLPEAKLDEVKTYAAMAYTALNCEGLARCDFFVEKNTGRVLINEINTFPGFTAISMYPKLMEHEGLPVPQLIDRLIALAVERTEKQHG